MSEQVVYTFAPQLRPIEYQGLIIYYTDFNDIACASNSILQWIESDSASTVPVAFDMEWAFNYRQGPGKTAVIQLCRAEDVCYVFQVAGLKRLPAALVKLLDHSKVCLHGVNIKNDLRKLGRDFHEVCVRGMMERCCDLGVWYNRLHNSTGTWSMERLVAKICGLQINKDKRIRASAWDTYGLSEEQQLYAAIDVYIARVMYDKLRACEIHSPPAAMSTAENGAAGSQEAVTSLAEVTRPEEIPSHDDAMNIPMVPASASVVASAEMQPLMDKYQIY